MLKLDTFQIFLTLFILIFSLYFFLRTTGATYQALKPKNVENFETTVKASDFLNLYSVVNKVTQLSSGNYPIYFDEKNGNVIIVYNTGSGSASSTLDVIVLNRNGKYMDYGSNHGFTWMGSGNTNETVMTSSFKSWIFTTPTSITLPFQIVYIPSDMDTYIQLIDPMFETYNAGFFFSITGARNVSYITPCQLETDKMKNLTPVLYPIHSLDNLGKNTDNQYIYDSYYDENETGLVYSMSFYVGFDIYNGGLIISSKTADSLRKITVYDRINGSTSGNNNTYLRPQQILDVNATIASNYNLNNWAAVDVEGSQLVLYMGISQNTVIALLQKDEQDASGKLFKLINVKRFDSNGNVIDGTVPDNNIKCPKNTDDDYLKWYWYWVLNGNPNAGWNGGPADIPAPPNNTCGHKPPTCGHEPPNNTCGRGPPLCGHEPPVDSYGGHSVEYGPPPVDSYGGHSVEYGPAPVNSATRGCVYNGSDTNSNDYILKTEIVPPVCPAYPAFLVNVQGSGCNKNSNLHDHDHEKNRWDHDDNEKNRWDHHDDKKNRWDHHDDDDADRRRREDDDRRRQEDDDRRRREDDDRRRQEDDDRRRQEDDDRRHWDNNDDEGESDANNQGSSNSNEDNRNGSSYAPANNLPVSNQGFVRPYTPGGSDYMAVTNSFSAFGR